MYQDIHVSTYGIIKQKGHVGSHFNSPDLQNAVEALLMLSCDTRKMRVSHEEKRSFCTSFQSFWPQECDSGEYPWRQSSLNWYDCFTHKIILTLGKTVLCTFIDQISLGDRALCVSRVVLERWSWKDHSLVTLGKPLLCMFIVWVWWETALS